MLNNVDYSCQLIIKLFTIGLQASCNTLIINIVSNQHPLHSAIQNLT